MAKSSKKLSLKQVLVFSLCGVSVLGLGLSSFAIYSVVSDLVYKNTKEDLQARVAAIETSIQVVQSQNIAQLKSEASSLLTHEPGIKEGKLPKYSGFNLAYFALGEGGLTRKSFMSSKANSNLFSEISSSSPIFKATSEGETYVERKQVGNEWYEGLYQPIYSANKTVSGVLYLALKEVSTEKLHEILRAQKLLATGYFFVFDGSGKMIMHPKLEGKNILETQDLAGRFIFKEMQEKKNGFIEYRWLNAETQKEQNKIAFFHYSADYDWFVAASLNVSEAKASVERVKSIIITANLVVMFIMALVALKMAGAISRKLTQIAQAVSETVSQVQATGKGLAVSSADLSQATQSQAAAITQTAASLEEIGVMLKNTAANTKLAQQTSQASQQEAEKASLVVEKLNHAMSDLLKVNQNLEEFTVLMGEISKKTNIINDIVSETRLLAFNASIEAARAGVHGRGFAVIADEVSKLAGLSGGAAVEIREILESGNTKVKEMLKTVDERVKVGERVSHECQAAFNAMKLNSDKITEFIREIFSATHEEEQGMRQGQIAMNDMEKSTERNGASAQKLAGESVDLLNASGRLEGSVAALNELLSGTSTPPGASHEPQAGNVIAPVKSKLKYTITKTKKAA